MGYIKVTRARLATSFPPHQHCQQEIPPELPNDHLILIRSSSTMSIVVFVEPSVLAAYTAYEDNAAVIDAKERELIGATGDRVKELQGEIKDLESQQQSHIDTMASPYGLPRSTAGSISTIESGSDGASSVAR